MGPGRKKSTMPLSKVPSVTELCNRLGFERASPIETSVFTDTTHAFRKSHRCSNGSAGANLTDWYSSSVQQELTAMAMRFLAEKGNGPRFWSETRRWKEDGDVTYPEDIVIIADLLKQLFWKQNKYALNNQTYSEKKAGEARDQSRDNTTPTEQTTQRASVTSTATLKPIGSQQRTYFGQEAIPHDVRPKGPIISLLDDERDDLVRRMQSTLPASAGYAGRGDIFEVPEDDSGHTMDEPMSKSTRHQPPIRTPNKISPQTGAKKSPGDKTTFGESSSAKRPKIGENGNGKNQKKRRLIPPKRASDRPKVPRVRPETVPDKVIDELLRIKPSDRRPTSMAEHAMPKTRNQHRQSSMTESPYISRPITQTEHIDIQPRNHSNLRDNAPSNESSIQRQESPVSMVYTFGTFASRDGLGISRTFSTPSSISEPQTPVQQPSNPIATPDPTSKPMPKVRGLFWIVTSPEPNYSEESWNNGQIKGKSLPAVIEEICSITHRDRIEKLKIRLKTSFAQTTITVDKDAEDHWESTKTNLEEKISQAFTRDRNQQTHFHIWIEPLYEVNAPVGGLDVVENGEIDW